MATKEKTVFTMSKITYSPFNIMMSRGQLFVCLVWSLVPTVYFCRHISLFPVMLTTMINHRTDMWKTVNLLFLEPCLKHSIFTFKCMNVYARGYGIALSDSNIIHTMRLYFGHKAQRWFYRAMGRGIAVKVAVSFYFKYIHDDTPTCTLTHSSLGPSPARTWQ